MFYKIAGSVLLGLCGMILSNAMNLSLSQTLRQTEKWLSILRYIKMQIDCYSMPVPYIIERCDIELLVACGYRGATRPESFKDLVDSCEIRDGETEKLIKAFSYELGRSYREDQLCACDYYFSLVDKRRSELASELANRKKLNSTLCVSGTLAVIILLI